MYVDSGVLCMLTAVQEERQRNKERDGDIENSNSANSEMPVEKILEAEMFVEPKPEHIDPEVRVRVRRPTGRSTYEYVHLEVRVRAR